MDTRARACGISRTPARNSRVHPRLIKEIARIALSPARRYHFKTPAFNFRPMFRRIPNDFQENLAAIR